MPHVHDRSDELGQLVDDERLDDLLVAVTLGDIAEAWHCYHRREARSYHDPDWWAIEFWMGLAFEREDVVRAGLMALIDSSEDEYLGHVGAGPLEAFVSEDESRMRWLEKTAAISPRLRHALRNVYCWGGMQDRYCERLERAAGGPLPRPKWPHPGSLPPTSAQDGLSTG
ncbi:MAG: hypothetical protein ACR2MO_10665 [Acidimicrobiales bacterium]